MFIKDHLMMKNVRSNDSAAKREEEKEGLRSRSVTIDADLD
jgi:hypothetical protein